MTPQFITLTTPTGLLVLNTRHIEHIEEDEDGRTCIVMAGRDEMHVVSECVRHVHFLLVSFSCRPIEHPNHP